MKSKKSLYKTALALSIITIVYNILEGLVSTFFGYEDETLALFGFGVDSFVEVISGFGILHMLIRIRNNNGQSRDAFENTALRITGFAFYILSASLILVAINNFINAHKPESTLRGVIISIISIITMSILIIYKLKVGKSLYSNAIIADANCTKTCLYLSVVLLISSAGYELTNIGGLDSLGAAAISWFSFNEGREAFEKAKTGKNCSCSHS